MHFSTRILGLSAAAAMLLSAVAIAQNQQPPAGPSPPIVRGGATSSQLPTPLYRMDNVVKTLSLTPEQINRLNAETNRLQTQYSRNFDQLNRLDERDRLTRLQELLNSYNTDWNKAAGDILNQTQMSRYQQLQLQQGGFTTFMNPTIQQQLNLTEQQLNKLRSEEQWSRQQLQQIDTRARVSPDQALDMYSQFVRDRNDRLNAILTPDQRRQWNSMIGPPFEFAPPFNTQRK